MSPRQAKVRLACRCRVFNVVSCSLTLCPGTTDVATRGTNQLSAEREFSGSSTFTRTVWLPRPVDANSVVAKLQDGILSLNLPKAEDKGSLKVRIE
jgi:hypothetical protein